MSARGRAGTIEWGDPCTDDNENVIRLLLETMRPAARETFMRNRACGESYAAIGCSTGAFQRIVRRRMLAAIRHFSQDPCNLETWLRVRAGINANTPSSLAASLHPQPSLRAGSAKDAR